METITFNVLKKNRKYFAATKNGYKCKILIDDNSQKLELGEQQLLVEDISVRSKYGTDLIFKLSGDAAKQTNARICTLRVPFYNILLVSACRDLGGKFDRDESVWVFNGIVEDKVEALDEIWNSELITVDLEYLHNEYGECAPVYYCGFIIAQAYHRDSGAKLGNNVALLEGNISSGGSLKNWRTVIKSGSIFRLQVPKLVLERMIGTEVEPLLNERGIFVAEQ